MIESGRIDQAHHDNQANRAVLETIALDNAVKVALDTMEGDDS